MAEGQLRRTAAYAYGVFAYILALATIAYAVGFLANAVVPKSVDAGSTHAVGDPLVVNVVLIAVFGIQHSLMARPEFKSRWTRIIPEPIERSTYVLCASLALIVLMGLWRPLPAVVWTVDGSLEPLFWAIYLGGWLIMFGAVNMIDGNRLLGLKQVTAYRNGSELQPIDFQTPMLYRYVRHPIMTGFLLAFWVTPRMTVGHFLFAAGMTVVVVVGTTLEERDLIATFEDRYLEYRRAVPAFLPRPWRSISSPEGIESDDT